MPQSTRKEDFIGQICLGKESTCFQEKALAWHVTYTGFLHNWLYMETSKCTTLKLNYKQAQPFGDHNQETITGQAKS